MPASCCGFEVLSTGGGGDLSLGTYGLGSRVQKALSTCGLETLGPKVAIIR